MSIWRFGNDTGRGGGEPREHALQRVRMVERQLRARGLSDERVLAAMEEVPRHLFVPKSHQGEAYGDLALPIGFRQTISQPYIVAFMTAELQLTPGHKILEVGTGSGYQAAILAACGAVVFTVERIPELHRRAHENLTRAGYIDRVHLRLGDGSRGWTEKAPFDRMLLTAAAAAVPPDLIDQLAPGGIIVAPVGDPYLQTIYRYRKRDGKLTRQALEGARFVPLIEDSTPTERSPDAAGDDSAGRPIS